MSPFYELAEAAFLLLCTAIIMASVGVGFGAAATKIRERRHMRLLQDDLDAAEREGRARDQRARALQGTFGRQRIVRQK